jgi:hypothetical protein
LALNYLLLMNMSHSHQIMNSISYKQATVKQLVHLLHSLSRKDKPTRIDFAHIEHIKKVIVSIINEGTSQGDIMFRHGFKETIGRLLESKTVSANDFDGWTALQLLIKIAKDPIFENNEVVHLEPFFKMSNKEKLFVVLTAFQKVRMNCKITPNEEMLVHYLTMNLRNLEHFYHVHDNGLDPKSDDTLAAIILHGACKWLNNHGVKIRLHFHAVAGSSETRYARACVLKEVVGDAEWITHNSVLPQNGNYSFPIQEGESVIIGKNMSQANFANVTTSPITMEPKSLFFITGFMNVDDLPVSYPDDFIWASQGSHQFSFNIGEILERKDKSVLDRLSNIQKPYYQDDESVVFTMKEWDQLYKLFQKECFMKKVTSISTVEFFLTVSAETVKETDSGLTDAFMRSFNISPGKWSTIFDIFQ